MRLESGDIVHRDGKRVLELLLVRRGQKKGPFALPADFAALDESFPTFVRADIGATINAHHVCANHSACYTAQGPAGIKTLAAIDKLFKDRQVVLFHVRFPLSPSSHVM
jgi:hypothetical protein